MGGMRPAAQPAKVVWTYRDYRLLPDDGHRYEVIDGELFVTPASTTTHQKVSKRIELEFMLQIEERDRGLVFYAPVDVILSDERVVQPDLVVIGPARESIVTERGIEGAPDLIVEILSARTRKVDREVKSKLYASVGVPEYWIVDPEAHSIEVFELGPDGFLLHARYGPGDRVRSLGFECELAIDRVFR